MTKVRGILAVVLLAPVAGLSDRPNLDRYSDAELWQNADFVGIVQIESGSFLASEGYELRGSILSSLKGTAESPLLIAAKFPQLSVPNQLGSVYLVFLERTSHTQYRLVRENHSSVRLQQVELEEEQALKSYHPIDLNRSVDWYNFEGWLWTVDCTADRTYSQFCDGDRASAQFAFSQVDSTQGN